MIKFVRKMSSTNRILEEMKHFSNLKHIWWGAKTVAGQKRYDNRFQLLRRMCKPHQGMKILEIGCGDGEFTKRLVQLKSSIVAIDVTPKVIQGARNIFKQKYANFTKVYFRVENAEKLSFSDATFDIVCGVSILHHVDIEKCLKEIFRVLRKNGEIFFSEPNLLNPQIFAGLHTPWLKTRMEFSPQETALVRWKVKDLLKRVGFGETVVKNYDFLHPNTPPYLIQMVENMSKMLEKTPLIKEVSGSLIIWAKRQDLYEKY